MGAKTAISVAEYLRTSYPDLDREYRDGEVLERTLPDYLHSRTQVFLVAFFLALQKTLGLFVCSELRVQIGPGLFRIPDISVFQVAQAVPVPGTPPFIAIEILSPDDRMSEVLSKLHEYRQWGVPHVWLVDPHAKRMFTCDAGLVEVPVLRVPEFHLEVQPNDIFE
ncbi:MAG: Uma2 family endonuclease [Bryobacteraceae bacterium]